MHELPQDLSNSLRSWRGGTHDRSLEHDRRDVEKGQYDHGDQSSAQSPLIRHPPASPRRKNNSQGREQSPNEMHLNIQKTSTSNPQGPTQAELSIFRHAPKVDDPDPVAERLEDNMTPLSKESFYELMGMHAPTTEGQAPKDLARRHGLYSKIRKRLSYVQTKYRIFDVVTYVFMALQLLLSAVFIVLGSLRDIDSHVVIAVLGAVSTVISGALALMKGQGLPNRLRQVRDDLANVLFEAEELYWDVAANREVLFEDIVKVREDYLRVLQEARRNHPDTWRGSADIVKRVRPHTRMKTTAVKSEK